MPLALEEGQVLFPEFVSLHDAFPQDMLFGPLGGRQAHHRNHLESISVACDTPWIYCTCPLGSDEPRELE
jgi:hypothetical protein